MAFTYKSGLRAPALIAVVKDLLIFITVIAAVIVIPAKLGGYGAIFAKVPAPKLILPAPTASSLGAYSAYFTLAFGSALALFLYPHSMTGILSSSDGNVIRRNAALLPAYSFVLGLIGLLGYMAIAAGVDQNPAHAAGFARYGSNYAVPALFLESFDSWFVGIAFAGIAIGALVPAAIMSIACANLFTRNLYKEFLRPDCSQAQEANMQDRVARGEGRGGGVHPRLAARLRHSAPAPRRHLDHPASAHDPTRPLHAMAQCVCLVGGLGHGACHRHLYGRDARVRHLGLSLVGVRRDAARIRGALFGAREFPARHLAYAALQPPLATNSPISR